MPRAYVLVVLAFLIGGAVNHARSADDQTPPQSVPDVIELEITQPESIPSDDDEQWQRVEIDESPRSTTLRELTAEQRELRDRIRRCLAHYFYHPETTRRRSPWGVMHAVVGFGVDTPLIANGRQVNAISWLCANAPCLGMNMLYGHNGDLGVRMGPGYQGHSGQFLCILAQSRVKIDYPMIINGQQMSVADLVRYEQLTCRAGTELTFKLIGLSYYLDSDASWLNQHGESWDVQRLIREELAQTITGAACGGTHRLTGFSYAVCKRETSGKPMTGQWARAKKFLDEFHEHAFKVQNPDGSFSTQWFTQRSDYGDINRKLNTTGHILEWLVYSLSEEQLNDARTVRAVEFLVNLLWQYRDFDWEIGPKGHAIHALALYDERLFGGQLGQRDVQLAQAANRAGDSTTSNSGAARDATARETDLGWENREANAPDNPPPRRRRRFR